MPAAGRCTPSWARRVDLRSERGWTLTELLISILVATFILGAATSFLSGVASLNGTTTRQIQALDDARRTSDHITTQLRNATGPPGGSPIYSPASGSAAGTTDIVFYVPTPGASTTNNPRGLQWVRYCLDYSSPSNEKLWMQTAPYNSTQTGPPSTAACPSTDPGWTTPKSDTPTCPQSVTANAQLVACKIVGMEATSSPSTSGCTSLSTPAYTNCPFLPGVVSGQTRDMRIKLIIQGDSSRTNTTITSSTDFRNVKGAPTAAIDCRIQNKHAICDASASADPDGQAISYKWWLNGTLQNGQTGYLYDTGLLASGTDTVKVRATDTDGLWNEASQTVTIP